MTKQVSNQEVSVKPLPYAVGAEIICSDVRGLGAEARNKLRQAWLDHMVLIVRGQQLTDAELIDFSLAFGDVRIASPELPEGIKERDREYPQISVISNVVENGVGIGTLGYGEARWHSDNSYREVPLAASLLYSLEIPPAGGETGFSNMYLALETLPSAMRQKIDTRSIKHDQSYNSAGQLRKGFTSPADVTTAPGPSHPIIRTHPETGYNALYLGRRPNAYINGLPLRESEELLDALWAHATREEITWHHEWKVGDILIWDNRCLMHHRNPFDPNSRRVMHRTQTSGTKPFRQPGAKEGHPRGRMRKDTLAA